MEMNTKRKISIHKLRRQCIFLLAVSGILYLLLPLFITRKSAIKETISLSRIYFGYDTPTIFIITPTYARLEQKADLTRLAQTLQLVPHIHWMVVEDSVNKTMVVTKLLQETSVSNTHLFVKSIDLSKWNNLTGFSKRFMHRGVQQRNLALDWLQGKVDCHNVVYFADDDNTYDVHIFEEMRSTNKISVWPVGLVGDAKYSSPAVINGTVVGWIDAFKPFRQFAMDMAGFAVNGDLLKKIPARFNLTSQPGYLETDFLSLLNVKKDELEPKANNCTQILVWHTETKETSLRRDNRRINLTQNLSIMELEE